jgi:hypothetical protein
MAAIAGRALALAAALACLSSGSVPTDVNATVETALYLYDRAEYDAAIARVAAERRVPGVLAAGDVPHVAPFGLELTTDALAAACDRWIAAGDPDTRTRRRTIAASFSLELIWVAALENSRLLSPRDSNATQPGPPQGVNLPSPRQIARTVAISYRGAQPMVLEWASGLMPASGAVRPAERFWWLASVGVSEEARNWRLLDEHLAKARLRLPDEPRWRLADLERRVRIETRPIGPNPVPERRPDALDHLGDKAMYHDALGRLSGLQREFEKLLSERSVAGEAELHLGYFDMLRARWADAIAHLDRARALTTEPFLLAVADYFIGWANEKLKQPGAALAAYRRAHPHAPRVRNLSILLAQQLFLANERAEGYAILDAALKADPAPPDLLTAFESGDARLVPDYLARLREALR